VLIVDDDASSRLGLAEIINEWGYVVETAREGMEGLEKAISYHPAIVLTDIRMPRVDGMMLLEHLGARRPEIAVVMVTAHCTTESIVAAMRLGAYDYIEKPISPERLRRVLENVAILQSLRAELGIRSHGLLRY
jgi:DNA-binding NtrC family response regulator